MTAKQQLKLEPGDVLLDIGCARGHFLCEVSPSVARAIGVDSSPGMIQAAKRYCRDVPGVEVHCADAVRLPFGDAVFTKINCNSVLMYLSSLSAAEKALAEMRRVAKPGARIHIGETLDLDRRPSFFSSRLSAGHTFGLALWVRRDELAELARRQGMAPQIVSQSSSMPYSNITFDLVADVS